MNAHPLADLLRSLMRLRGVRGALLADARDGIPVASTLDVDVDGDAVAALAVSLHARAARAAAATGQGETSYFQLRARDGWLCAVAGGPFVLAVVAGPCVDAGRLRLALLRARPELAA